jgi:hypothetical protein
MQVRAGRHPHGDGRGDGVRNLLLEAVSNGKPEGVFDGPEKGANLGRSLATEGVV